jgi:hypothetical protein
MLSRLTRALIALLVALAVSPPVGAQALPTPATAPEVSSVDVGHPCQSCPDIAGSGMTGLCSVASCVGPMILPPGVHTGNNRLFRRVGFPGAIEARLAGAAPAPEPFPPKPIVLA